MRNPPIDTTYPVGLLLRRDRFRVVGISAKGKRVDLTTASMDHALSIPLHHGEVWVVRDHEQVHLLSCTVTG